jgi:hypothetical protein
MSITDSVTQPIGSGPQRVRIVGDMDPSEPYNDGGSPLFRLDYRYGWDVEQVRNLTGYDIESDLTDGISTILNRYGFEVINTPLWDRYLSIWWGVTKTETWHSGTSWYMTCDPVEWRNWLGGAPAGSISMAEWQAYCVGDVYGVVLEEEVEWTSHRGETRLIWEAIDSCWGFYGDDAAKEYAAETYPDLPLVEGGA